MGEEMNRSQLLLQILNMLLYLVIPAGLFCLGLMARQENLPEGVKKTGVEGVLNRCGHLLYRRFCLSRGWGLRPGVREDLGTMYPQITTARMQEEYYTGKLALVLVILLAGSLLGLASHIQVLQSDRVLEGQRMERAREDGSSYETTLEVQDPEGVVLGNYPVTIRPRQYTKEEADGLFRKACAEMERLYLGENASPDQVCKPLCLKTELESYPFAVEWSMDNYDRLPPDGIPNLEGLDPEGVVVTLTATWTYAAYEWEQILPVRLVPEKLTEEEQRRRALGRLLTEAEQNSLTEPAVNLPSSYQNLGLRWKELVEDHSLLLLLIAVLTATAAFWIRDRELQKQVALRQEELLARYSTFVSQLVLYMGAGMTLRNVVGKLSGDYQKRCHAGEKKVFLYEELSRMNRELESGTSEADAISHLDLRCRSQPYTRLCSLLSQNLKKGNSRLLPLLRQESDKAISDRLAHARKLGEQAGTKLLLPMMLMLAVVMVLIMVPAYLSF